MGRAVQVGGHVPALLCPVTPAPRGLGGWRVLCCLARMVATPARRLLSASGSGRGFGVLGGVCASWPQLRGVCRALGLPQAGGCSWVGSAVFWGCHVVVRFPAVLVSFAMGLFWVAGLGVSRKMSLINALDDLMKSCRF